MDVYSYENLTNTTLSIGGYTILPYGEVVSNGSTIAVLDAENGGRLQKYLNGVLVPVTGGSSGIPATWTDASRSALVGAGGVPVPVSGAGKSAQRMLTVFNGNSIAVASQYTGVSGGYTMRAEIMLANTLAGAPMKFNLRTASTRLDAYGGYGYSGQTLATINTDLLTNFYPPLAAEGTVPDLVCGLALVENDLGSSVSYATMVAGLTQWIRTVQALWPGALIWLCTPRLSRGYTAPQVANYLLIRDYMLGLDDGVKIFVTRCDGYESAPNSGLPTVSTFTASISGTTMTVTDAGSGIRLGCVIDGSGVTAGTTISSAGTAPSNGDGTYGIGTYTVSASQTVASTTITLCLYTDSSVHPNPRGALINARRMAATLQRIASRFVGPFLRQSSNAALSGSTAATGTGASGTVPTGCTSNVPLALGAVVNTAEGPGWLQTFNQAATGSVADLASSNSGSVSLPGAVHISPYATIQLVSGSQYLRVVQLEPRVTDGSGSPFCYFLRVASGDPDMDWMDGDVLTFSVPPIAAVSGSIASENNYYRASEKAHSIAPITFRIVNQGVDVVNQKAAATATGLTKIVTVTSAQLLALNATPIAILGAPGAGLAYLPTRLEIYKAAGTAYAGVDAGDDLVLKYTNAAGAQCSGVIEATGFLDQSTAQNRVAGMPGATGATASDYAPVANAAVVLHLLGGEITTGTSDLRIAVRYDIISTVF